MKNRSLIRTLFAWVAALLTPIFAFAHGNEHVTTTRSYDPQQIEETPFGRQGDPKQATRTIALDMSDAMRFAPARITVERGETVRLVARNQGRALHELVLGTAEALNKHAELMRRFPEMEHDEAHMAHVKPGQSGEIVWQFTHAGQFQFACLIPGHLEAGMRGTVEVK